MLRLFSGWSLAPDAPERRHKVCSTSCYLTLGINILWLTYRTGLHEVSLLSSHLCSQSSSGLFFPVLQLMTHRIRTTCSHTSLSSHTNQGQFFADISIPRPSRKQSNEALQEHARHWCPQETLCCFDLLFAVDVVCFLHEALASLCSPCSLRKLHCCCTAVQPANRH